MLKDNFQLKRWQGKFGRDYTNRNSLALDGLEKLYKKRYGITRLGLNRIFLGGLNRSIRILEVGSNIGNQLLCLKKMGFKNLYGIEPQRYAVEIAKKRAKDIDFIWADAFDIPFKDGYFDLVFTSGVLIHIHPKNIKNILKEIHRCTNRYIWGYEYYADKYTEVPYRGEKLLLWKTDFPKHYLDLFNDLKLIKEKKLKHVSNNNIDIMFLLKKKGQ